MSLKAKIKQLNKDAGTIHELTRSLNIIAATLNGVAAVIPHDVPAFISYFKGCKIILHNVSYDHSTSCISAAVTFPYIDGNKKHISGCTYRFNIDESWFE